MSDSYKDPVNYIQESPSDTILSKAALENAKPVSIPLANGKADKKVEKDQVKARLAKIWLTQTFIALVCAGITAAFAYIINPPLTQKKRENDLYMEGQDWRWVILISFVVFLLVLLIPEVVRLLQIVYYDLKKKSDQKAAKVIAKNI